MRRSYQNPVAATGVWTFPSAPNRADLTLRELCDAYMAGYVGRDDSRERRLAYWVQVMGEVKLRDLDIDAIADATDALAHQSESESTSAATTATGRSSAPTDCAPPRPITDTGKPCPRS